MNIDPIINYYLNNELIFISLASGIILAVMIYLISLDVLCNFPRLKDYKSNNLKKMKYRGLGVLYLAALIPFFIFIFHTCLSTS